MSEFETSPPAPAPVPPAVRGGGRASKRTWLWVRAGLLRLLAGPVAALAIAFFVGALVLWPAGYDPLYAYRVLVEGAFGSVNSLVEVLLQATPLILIGAGLAIAFRCSIWNIGAEGQFYVGAVVCTWVGLTFTQLPAILLMPLALVGGTAGGAAWGFLAGYLKTRFGANEVVTTIMLNYVAIFATSYLVTGPWIEPPGNFPQTPQIAQAARLLRILPGTRLHIGFLIALVVAAALYILIFKTSIGYSIRAAGMNPTAARYAGINVDSRIWLAMAISGGAAGLAGAIEIAGLTFRLFQSISPGYGFTGIAVALLVDNNPLGTILSGILFGALQSGSEVMQIGAGVPSVLIRILQGLVLLASVGLGVYRLNAREEKEQDEPAPRAQEAVSGEETSNPDAAFESLFNAPDLN